MAAGTALFTAVAAYAGTIYEGALYTLRETVSVMPSVTTFGDVSGFAPRIGKQYGSVTFASVAETADLTAQKFDPSNLSTLTPGEFGAQVMLTDQRVESDPEGVAADAAFELGLGAADYIDAALCTDFASFTGGTVGGTGTTLAWSSIAAARAIMKYNKVPGPYFCTVHPYQWHHLVKEAATNGGATFNPAPGFSEQILRQWLVSSLFGDVTFIVSANVPIGGTTGSAGMYSRLALAYDQRRGLRIEPQRDASFRHTELNATLGFAHGVWAPTRGVLVLSLANTPS